jgi:hypothetical protein
MAQTGYTPIQLYYSSTTTSAPLAANIAGGELAINITDGKLFYKDNANAIQVIGWKTTPTSAGGTGLISYTAGDLLYYASGTALSKLGIGTNGQILKSTGTAPVWETASNFAVTSISFGATGLTPSAATQGVVTVAGTLVAANGGTGQSSYTVGDILYASASTTLSKLPDVASGNALISGGVGVAPSWGKIDLTTHVSGILPIANGGTNKTSFTNNYIHYGSFSTSANFQFDGNNVFATGSFYKYSDVVISVATGTNTTTNLLTLSANGTYLVSAWGNSNGGDQVYSGVAIVTIYNDGFTYRAAITSLMTRNFSWVSIVNNSSTTNGQITFQQTSGFTGNVWFKAQLLTSS